MRKLKNHKATDQEDNFRRLPEELLISIFTMLADLKLLCQCSLVCKRFACTISRVQTISITVPGNENEIVLADMCALYQEILSVSGDKIPGLIQSSSIPKLNFFPFLMKFRELNSIYLDFTSSLVRLNSPFLGWKVKCGSCQNGFESLVCVLSSASIQKRTEFTLDDEVEYLANFQQFFACQLIDCYEMSSRWRERVYLLLSLIKCHISLKSVTITDSEKQGKLVVRDEMLTAWRNILLNGENWHRKFPVIVKIAQVPVLHVPLSEYVMKRARLMIMKFPGQSNTGDDDIEDIMTWDYGEGEEILGKAVKEILLKRRKPFMKFHIKL